MGRNRKPDPIRHCMACGALLTRKTYKNVLESMGNFIRRKYCDQHCMAMGQEGQIKILNERNSRRQSAKTVKSCCEICGRNKSRLHVHHRDHNPLNNSSGNLQTLCGSCHRRSHSPNYPVTPKQRRVCLYCSKPVARKGLCNTHLTRLKRCGDPLMKKVKCGSEWVLRQVDG